MRIGININVCLTLVDNDTCEVSIRHEEGMNRDKEVVKLDLPYEAEFITNITQDTFRAILFDLLLRSETSINTMREMQERGDILKEKREQAKREDDARDEAEQRGEVWACQNCEMVNVVDAHCARCGVPRDSGIRA